MKQFAVIGNPVAHSRSPDIHAAFAAQFHIALSYRKLPAAHDKFFPTVQAFFERGNGVNVTLPFKEEALKFADKLSNAARLAGAVNTLSRQGGLITGDNTDGIGLVRDIRDNQGFTIAQKSILIIGVGGAARGVLLPLSKEQPGSITLSNRNIDKARMLNDLFKAHTTITVVPLNKLDRHFDLVINATSASLSGEKIALSPAVFNKDTLAYDMVYSKNITPFMQSAAEHRAHIADGLGMLVEQAAASFALWHGIRPETHPVITMIRKQLSD